MDFSATPTFILMHVLRLAVSKVEVETNLNDLNLKVELSHFNVMHVILYLREGQALVIIFGHDFQQVDAEHVEHHALVRAERAGDGEVVEQLHHPLRPQHPLVVAVAPHLQQQPDLVLGHLLVLRRAFHNLPQKIHIWSKDLGGHNLTRK
jgi:hypothetical protein